MNLTMKQKRLSSFNPPFLPSEYISETTGYRASPMDSFISPQYVEFEPDIWFTGYGWISRYCCQIYGLYVRSKDVKNAG